jgi:hypothetical protein
MSQKLNRVGEIGINNQGMEMKIVGYRNNKDIDILFSDNTLVCNQPYSVFHSGEIKNNNIPYVNGVGYIGYGKYKCRINGKLTEEYKIWSSMILRNYCSQYLERQETYKKCSVCDEWLNFQTFAKWYFENKWTNEFPLVPDKDILIKGNKEYNPNTVLLLDQRLNNLFLSHKINRGNLPIGVRWDKERNKYVASCKTKEYNKKFIGRFDDPIEAFYAYRDFKYQRVKEIVNYYKETYNLPQKIYDAIINYKIEITD